MFIFFKILIAAATYLGAILVAQALVPNAEAILPVWPAAGVGFVAMHLLGPVCVPALLAADILGNVLGGAALPVATYMGLTDTLALWLGAMAVRRAIGLNPFDGSLRNLLIYLALGPLFTALCTTVLGAGVLRGLGVGTILAPDLWSWFLSRATGIIVFAPLLTAWALGGPIPPRRLQETEGILLFLGAAVTCWLVFGLEHGLMLSRYPLIFAFIPFMAWAVFRGGLRLTTALLAMLFCASLAFTIAGTGPFRHLSTPLSLHLLQVFTAITAGTSLAVHVLLQERTSAFEELKQSEKELREAKQGLEQQVIKRTSKLREALDELRDAEETYRTIFENATEGLYRADVSGRFIRANAGLADILGYASPTELIEKVQDVSRQVFMDPGDRHRLFEQLSTKGHVSGFEARLRRRDGTPIWAAMSVRPVMGQGDTILGTEGIIQDITQRKLSEDELMRRATRDPLTDAANRHSFDQSLRKMLSQASRSDEKLALLFIDLDDFKRINDTFGHQAGDQLLADVVKRIRRRLRDADILARLGGDEFAVIVHDIDSAQDVSRLADALIEQLVTPFEVQGSEQTIGASIGGSLFPGDGTTPEDLLKHADIAMYQAKQHGKNHHRLYNTSVFD